MWGLLVSLLCYLKYAHSVNCYEGSDLDPCYLATIHGVEVEALYPPENAMHRDKPSYFLPEKGMERADLPDVPPEPPRDRQSIQSIIDVQDIRDRVDHFTQYLSDLTINTDEEITSLQASEHEDERNM